MLLDGTHTQMEFTSNKTGDLYKVFTQFFQFMSNKNKSTQKQKQNKQKPVVKRIIRKARNVVGQDNYGKQMQSVLNVGLSKTLQMYPSTLAFGKIYGDPFLKENARLPVLPILPTKMLRTVASGNGIFNSSGVFYITTSPGLTVTSNFNSVWYSNNSASPPFIDRNTETHPIGVATMKSPYTMSDFEYGSENGLSFRLVSLGIRVKYTGTVLNASGTVFMAQTNPRVSMDGYTTDDIKKMQGFKEYPFRSGKWHPLIRHLTQENDKDFIQQTANSFVYSENNTASLEGQNYLSLIAIGTPASTVEWEVVAHFEICGPLLEDRAVGHVDSKGTETIVNSFAKKRDKDSTTPDHTMDDNKFTKFINTVVSGAEKLLPLLPNVLAML